MKHNNRDVEQEGGTDPPLPPRAFTVLCHRNLFNPYTSNIHINSQHGNLKDVEKIKETGASFDHDDCCNAICAPVVRAPHSQEVTVSVVDATNSDSNDKNPTSLNLESSGVIENEDNDSSVFHTLIWIAVMFLSMLAVGGASGILAWRKQQTVISRNPSLPSISPSVRPTISMNPTIQKPFAHLDEYYDSLMKTVMQVVESDIYDDILDDYVWKDPRTAQFDALRFVVYRDGGITNGGEIGYYLSDNGSDLLLQRLAVLTLYFQTGGAYTWTHTPDSTNDYPWIVPGMDECNLEGVRCDENFRITHLHLKDRGLQGSIPVEFLVWLPHLRVIDLSSNNLSGSLPISVMWPDPSLISFLPALEHLDFSKNNLDGSLPTVIGAGGLPSLRFLNLEENKFSGLLPRTFEFTVLQELYLGSNRLTGTLPFQHWFRDSQEHTLRVIHLSDNLFNGTVPFDALAANYALERLALSRNKGIHGRLPLNFARFELLQQLHLSDCDLEGTIPFDQLFGMPSLEQLSLASNRFQGSFPTEMKLETLKTKSSLRTLNLGNNRLTGRLPPGLFDQWLTELSYLQVFGNDLSGSIPTKSFCHLSLLWLHDNPRLFGRMPCPEYSDCENSTRSLLYEYSSDCTIVAKSITSPNPVSAIDHKVTQKVPTPRVQCSCCVRCY